MTRHFSPDPAVLIVEDEIEVIEGFELLLNSAGFDNVRACTDAREVMARLQAEPDIDVILLDLLMPHIKGAQLLPLIAEQHPQIPVIIVTALDEIDTAVACMKAGAFDYLVKPVEKLRLITSVRRAFEKQSVQRENTALKQQLLNHPLTTPDLFAPIITRNPAMLGIFKYIEAISRSSEPVLITGETGVGKELIARAIHRASRLNGPFIAVNTAGLDDQSFSDTLFGHRKGAYTGAEQQRDGLVKKAAQGTLFLDEISDASPTSQVKLLRLLQEKEYYPLGSDLAQTSQARILAASNQRLEAAIDRSDFRKDLYFRLKTHQIVLPPLRERHGDLPLLLEHFIAKACKQMGKPSCDYPAALPRLLAAYPFSGNIREMESMVFDAVSAHNGKTLSLARFHEWIGTDSTAGLEKNQLGKTLIEKNVLNETALFADMASLPTLQEAAGMLVREAMRRADNNQSVASRFLGISQPALSKRIKNLEKKEA